MIRVGIGGWNFEPWKDNFYPKGLSAAKELGYASRQLPVIEINGTYYSTQKPSVFAKWRDETPENFVFSLKASRFATNRRELAGGADAITRFENGDLVVASQFVGGDQPRDSASHDGNLHAMFRLDASGVTEEQVRGVSTGGG